MTWFELLDLMVVGPRPEPTVRGAIAEDHSTEEYRGFARVGQPPVIAGARTGSAGALQVWRDGARIRIEEPDGRPNLIVGAETCWQFDREHDTPIASPASAVHYLGSATNLLQRRSLESFLGGDFTTPTGPVTPTTFLDRAAWAVELAPPQHKPHPLQLVVDAATGLVLQQRNDGFGYREEWVAFVVGEGMDDDLFTWSGPARDEADERARHRAEDEREMARRVEWFARNVTPSPLRVTVTIEVMVHSMNDDGGFEASLINPVHGSLGRRRRSASRWEELGSYEVQERWSDDTWDWALTVHGVADPQALADIKRQLSS